MVITKATRSKAFKLKGVGFITGHVVSIIHSMLKPIWIIFDQVIQNRAAKTSR